VPKHQMEKLTLTSPETCRKLLNAIDEIAIVVTPEFDLIWVNETTGAWNQNKNVKCYSYLFNQESPCPGCVISELSTTRLPASSEVIFRSPFKAFLVKAYYLERSPNFLVLHQDVTEILLKERTLQTIIQNIPFGIILTNQDLQIIYISMALFSLFPFIESPIEGRDLRLIVSRYSPPFPKELLDFLFSLSPNFQGISKKRFEFGISTPSQRLIEIFSIPVHDKLGLLSFNKGFIFLFIDQTSRVLQQSLQEQIEIQSEIGMLFTELYTRLTPSLKKIQSLSINLSPDKNSRLNDTKYIASVLPKESGRLISLLEGLNHYGKTKKGKTTTQINLHSLLRKILDNLAPQLSEKGIKVKLDLTRHLKPFMAEKGKISQVLKEILLNAIEGVHQNAPAGGETIYPLIEIQTRMQGTDMELTIKDNGTGIGQDDLKLVFKPGFTTKDRSHHSGMGLFFCQVTIRNIGGTINISSVQDVGTKVIVKIPALSPLSKTKWHNTPSVGKRKRIKGKRYGIFRDMQICIMGEKDFATDVIKKFVSKNGADCETFKDPSSFSKRIEWHLPPSVFIINVSKEKTALSFIALLEEKGLLSQTLIVAPEEAMSDIKRRLKGQDIKFIKKPFHVNSLMETLIAMIG